MVGMDWRESSAGVEALLQCSFDSLASLWLSTDTTVGGFGWNAQRIGNYLCFVCPMQAMNCIEFAQYNQPSGALSGSRQGSQSDLDVPACRNYPNH